MGFTQLGHGLHFIGLTLALGISGIPTWADPIEVQHPVYELLRRGEALGSVPLGFTATLPKERNAILAALHQMDAASSDTWTHTAIERYHQELDQTKASPQSPLIYHDSMVTGGLQANYYTGGFWQDSLPRPQAFAFGTFGIGINATYRNHFFGLSQAFLGQERSHVHRFLENYNPSEGLPYNTDREGKAGILRGVSTFDGFRTVVGFSDGMLKLDLGQDWNTWGPGVFQHVTLGPTPWFWVQDNLAASDSNGYQGTLRPGGYRHGYRIPGEAAPLPQVRLAFSAGRFEYVKTVAQRMGISTDSAAWLIAHRLVWQASSRISVGATEMVALAGRFPDLAYLIPLVPLKYAEHQIGDRDNIAISFDVTARLPGRIRAFGEILLDDFSGPPIDFWGNKFAFTLGASFVDPGLPRTDLHVEASHVSPWVYGHHRRDTQFQSFGALLGSSLPPNSHRIKIAGIHHWRQDLDLSLGYDFMQRSVGERSASIFSAHLDSIDGTQSDFLKNRVETRQTGLVGATWKWRRYLEIQGQCGALWVDAWKGEKGINWMTPVAQGNFRITY